MRSGVVVELTRSVGADAFKSSQRKFDLSSRFAEIEHYRFLHKGDRIFEASAYNIIEEILAYLKH